MEVTRHDLAGGAVAAGGVTTAMLVFAGIAPPWAVAVAIVGIVAGIGYPCIYHNCGKKVDSPTPFTDAATAPLNPDTGPRKPLPRPLAKKNCLGC